MIDAAQRVRETRVEDSREAVPAPMGRSTKRSAGTSGPAQASWAEAGLRTVLELIALGNRDIRDVRGNWPYVL